jgi:hypothetical protein
MARGREPSSTPGRTDRAAKQAATAKIEDAGITMARYRGSGATAARPSNPRNCPGSLIHVTMTSGRLPASSLATGHY